MKTRAVTPRATSMAGSNIEQRQASVTMPVTPWDAPAPAPAHVRPPVDRAEPFLTGVKRPLPRPWARSEGKGMPDEATLAAWMPVQARRDMAAFYRANPEVRPKPEFMSAEDWYGRRG